MARQHSALNVFNKSGYVEEMKKKIKISCKNKAI